MKPFQLQSYYELLEVPVSATTEQIRRAYDRLCSQYGDEQVALYGLVEASSAGALRARLLEAMEILTDDDLRVEYDKDLGLPPRRRAVDDDDAPSAQLQMNDLLTGADRALQSTHPYVPFSYVTEPAAPPPQAAVLDAPLPLPSAPSAPPTIAEAIAPPPPPPSVPTPRPSPAQAPQMSESGAIAVAESQLAKVATVVAARDARASAPRPKPPDLPIDAEFNGELLRKVRTAVGLTIAQISDKTRISKSHLDAIEADRYAALPVPVYLRGILMNYARELGLDGLKVAKSYLALVEKTKG